MVKKNSNKRSVQIGDRAPYFTLPDQTGRKISLNNLIGKKSIVLYFYPKDGSPGCTTQACTFRDQYQAFKDQGAEVIGISSDSVEKHREFALKYSLPFTILSDNNGKVRKLYGVPSSIGILPGRVTYIIDRKGIVRYIFSSQLHVKEHVNKALEKLLDIEVENADNRKLDIRI